MKKYLLLAGCIAILATGCGNKNNVANSSSNINTAQKQITVNNEVKVIAKELAIAAANNDNDKMVKLGNDLMAKNAIPKEILIKGDCREVVYSYMGEQDSVSYCK